MVTEEEKPPRILVEGGPFWRHTRYTLWFFVGCIAGVVIAFIIAFHSIQSSRFQACEATNHRNHETTKALEVELAQAHLNEVQRKQTLTFTLVLINDLVPTKDCHKTIY